MKNIVFVLIFIATAFFYANDVVAQVIITFAGTGTLGYSGDGGPATLAELTTPSGVAVDKTGNVYITDQNNSRIRKVSPSGVITSIAGKGVAGYSGDGGLATNAMLNWPTGLAIDTAGNVYIADQFNNVIRKVAAAAGIITTIAGNNALIGFSGDGGPATNAALWHPADVGVDHSGNVYFVDQDNSVVRKVNTATGIITTAAGIDTAGYSGDGGPATKAKLNFPQGIAVDSAGNVYIADFYNSCIRKVNTATGIITTVAGNGMGGYSGDGGPATNAEIYDASAVAIDDSGNMYISDYYNSMIRKVNAATGIITTIAGNGTAAYCCDCNLATNAEMNYPEGVAVDKKGNVYIADFGNARVRKVTDSFHCLALHDKESSLLPVLNIFPNPSPGQFCIRLSNLQSHEKTEIYSAVGAKVYETDLHELQTNVDLSDLPAGMYIFCLRSDADNIVRKLIISR
jgi:sugar lactone lactonase YvrE